MGHYSDAVPMGAALEQLEQTEGPIRAKMERPFMVIKRHSATSMASVGGWPRTPAANLVALFVVFNLLMVRKRLLNMGTRGVSAPKMAQRAEECA